MSYCKTKSTFSSKNKKRGRERKYLFIKKKEMKADGSFTTAGGGAEFAVVFEIVIPQNYLLIKYSYHGN